MTLHLEKSAHFFVVELLNKMVYLLSQLKNKQLPNYLYYLPFLWKPFQKNNTIVYYSQY